MQQPLPTLYQFNQHRLSTTINQHLSQTIFNQHILTCIISILLILLINKDRTFENILNTILHQFSNKNSWNHAAVRPSRSLPHLGGCSCAPQASHSSASSVPGLPAMCFLWSSSYPLFHTSDVILMDLLVILMDLLVIISCYLILSCSYMGLQQTCILPKLVVSLLSKVIIGSLVGTTIHDESSSWDVHDPPTSPNPTRQSSAGKHPALVQLGCSWRARKVELMWDLKPDQ